MKAGIAIAALLTLTVAACAQTVEPADDTVRAPLTIRTAEAAPTVAATYQPTPDPGPQSTLIAAGVFPEPTPEPIYEAPAPLPVYETADAGWTYYGTCTITYYCPGSCCCGQYASGYTASGTLATPGRTVAADLPFGTEVLINGQVYTVEDRGVNGLWIDIFVASHEEALQCGMHPAEVYIR